MAISGYTFPQVQLYEYLANVQAANPQILYPLVVGPKYLLSRYGKETVVPEIVYDAQSADQLIPWQYSDANGVTQALPGTNIPDRSFTELFGIGLEATLATILTGDSMHFNVLSSTQTNTIIALGGDMVSGGTLIPKLQGRPVQIGDIAYITYSSITFRRTVVAIQGVNVASSFGTNGSDSLVGGGAYNPPTQGSPSITANSAPVGISLSGLVTSANLTNFAGSVQGALYQGVYGEKFTFTVTIGGAAGTAQVAVTSASGLYAGTITSTNSSGDFLFTDVSGGGATMASLAVKLHSANTGSSLVVGQVFTFTVIADYTRLTNTASTGNIITAGTYGLNAATTYTLRVTTGTVGSTSTGAVLTITDSAGIDTPRTVTVTDGAPFAVGNSGLTATITIASASLPQGGLRNGDMYYIECLPITQSTSQFDKVVLSGPVIDPTVYTDYTQHVQVEFRLPFTGQIPTTEAAAPPAWTQGSTGVTIAGGLSLNVPARNVSFQWIPFVNNVGNVALYFRALVPASSTQALIPIETEADITTNLGTIDTDNDLAYAAWRMLVGGLGLITGFALPTTDVTPSAFVNAFQIVANSNSVYAITSVSTDVNVGLALLTHVATASGPSALHFRKGYFGTDSPGSYAALTTYNSSPVNGTVTTYGGQNVLFTCTTGGVDLTQYGMQAGDIIKFPVLGSQFIVASILSSTEILLTAGPVSAISPAQNFQLWRANTPTSQSDFVRARSRGFGSRRLSNIWVENGQIIDSTGAAKTIPARYIAGEIVGLRCAMQPQQGMTFVEITSITQAPAMYSRYTSGQLDTIAADGTWIIMQDAENGACYTRHQLTTDTQDGALGYEDNIGVVVDYIAFQAITIVRSFLGKKNLTTRTMIDLRNELSDMLNNASQTTINAQFGPVINSWDSLKITPDSQLKDRAAINMNLYVALPFNIGIIYVNVNEIVNLAPVVQ